MKKLVTKLVMLAKRKIKTNNVLTAIKPENGLMRLSKAENFKIIFFL